MTVQQALIWANKQLEARNITTASLDAEVLLSSALNKPKEFLYTYPEKILTSRQARRLKFLTNRRAKFEPVAYLTGYKEFYGLNFYVDKRVLIPRPVTELLIDEVLREMANRKSRIANRKLTIADIGTGSGAIIITLAKILSAKSYKLKAISYYATDISKSALAVAKKNANCHQAKITFLTGNLLEPVKDKKIDVVIANLPYLDNERNNLLESSNITSLKYEPQKALKGGRYGLAVYEKFFQQLSQRLVKPKIILCEIGQAYPQKTKDLVKKYLPQSQIKIKKDLAGFNRVLIISLKR